MFSCKEREKWGTRRPPTSGFAVDFRPPPAHADEQEPPVAEEFRRFAFDGMTDELEDPSHHEQSQRVEPKPMEEEAGNKDCDREQNGGNAERVAEAVDGMLVAARVLCEPLIAGASA